MTALHIEALKHAEQGNWDAAHDLVQDRNDTLSCLIHGYLHREEGDEFNARYWYQRAGQSMPATSLNDELARLYSMAQDAQ
ncbi:hypothetical protein [Alteromonas gilva]|uniref:Sel1 repeat family protein n=1 Tax=Alteromonas gilva TaxID=2987522 RepID=A0ABT5L4I6_9ALTE|nr:hypothetical protein [Alteromonas gilva]MDC8831963.1 hypothetical protein [Alteromonas gilva]